MKMNQFKFDAFYINLSSLQDVYIYNENGVTLLGTDNKTQNSTYLIQLNLQLTTPRILTDLQESVENVASNKSSKESNLLMIKAEKLNGILLFLN